MPGNLARFVHEPPAESARCTGDVRTGRDAVVSLTRRGSGRSNDAADSAQIALAGGGLMNKAGEGPSHRGKNGVMWGRREESRERSRRRLHSAGGLDRLGYALAARRRA